MPPAPEIREARRDIRAVEIDRQPVAEQRREPHGDQRIAEEIGEDLA
jgi:hypothetical protein